MVNYGAIPVEASPAFQQCSPKSITWPSSATNTTHSVSSYEAVFGLKSSAKGRPASAITIGDGYAGLNLIPRRDGYVGGIDHFGMVVDDVEPVLERMKRKHKNAAIVKRPSARPFAAYSGHDPDGNVFDLAQKKEDTRKEVYAEIAGGGWAQDRYINKFAIRTPNAEECAEFYRDVFELEAVSRQVRHGLLIV